MKSLIRNLPVALFYYKGTHSHPVKRVVLITENNQECLIGYEIQCAKTIRTREEAPVKSYKKEGIAKWGDYSRIRNAKKNRDKDHNQSTLQRMSIKDYESSLL